MAEVYQIPQGRQASARLIPAWAACRRLSRVVDGDQGQHLPHLCALDRSKRDIQAHRDLATTGTDPPVRYVGRRESVR